MGRAGDVEPTAAAFLTAGRALLGIAVRSVAAAPVPLTVPQHRLLVLVSGEPRRVGSLADDLGVNQSNASRLVDRLRMQGLVRRARDPEDGRGTVVGLTPAGRAVLETVAEHRMVALRAIVAQMPRESRARAAAALHEFNVAAHEAEGPGPAAAGTVAGAV